MTTLEVVEAVQRSLENEGFLQGIRAQLRANVLRIISSGPNYVSHSGKIVEFSQQRSGAVSLYLVKDLLLKCGLRESLAVFEAEAGLQVMQEVDTDVLLTDLGLQNNRNDCFLNCLIHNMLTGNMEVMKSKFEVPKSQDDYSQDEQSVQENISIQESDSMSEGRDDEVYSAIDMEHKANRPSVNLNGQNDPPTTIFSGFGRARVDESSSFEADSPGKNLGGSQQGRHQPVEESFDEKEDVNSSIEEESLHVTGGGQDVAEGKDMNGDEHGPEYDSGRDEDVQFPSKRSYAAVVAAVDLTKGEGEEEEEEEENATTSLRLATEDDFDRLDRSSTLSGVSNLSSNRNRIAVRRAAAEGRDGSDPGSRSSSSRANIVRLNQASTSRSQTGWSSGEMQELDDFEELDDTDEPVDHRGENPANSSMESRSFEEEGVESFQYNKHSGAVDVHRSNNQEDEQDTHSRDDKSGSDIGEEDFEEEDFEEEDHGTQPNFVTRNRPAFLSPDNPPAKQQFGQNEDSNPNEKDEGEEEYADDAFDEDEEAEEDHEMNSSSAKPASPPQPAFVPSSRPGTGYRPSFSSSHDNAEEEDMESVEEEIEDEEDMMSVGADSDEGSGDGDFRHVVKEKAPTRQQRQDDILGLTRSSKSGALSTAGKSTTIGSNFDTMLNSFEDSDEESEAGKPVIKPGITARMREIDNQLENMHHDDSTGELDQVRRQFEQRGMGDDESNSVASEDVDAMEFSTGEAHDGSEDSSGEGSFSFLDSSTKK